MTSHAEANAPTCCICSKLPLGKCFVLACDHILCGGCCNEGASYITYGCNKHKKRVGIISLAFCHCESKTLIRMSDSVEFALKGQCNYKQCSKRQMTRFSETLYFEEKKKCVIRKDNDRLCNKQGCFYTYSCKYTVCCECLITHITDTHIAEYVEKSLTDVIYCLHKNCAKIIIVGEILKSLSKIEQEWKYNESMMCAAYKRCLTTNCKNTVTAVFSKCNHNYCNGCLQSATLVDIPMNGELIECRKCPSFACKSWIRDSILNSISFETNDFLRESSRMCCDSQHGLAVVETRCCLSNLCLQCLSDVMRKSGVVATFFGHDYDDVIMCNERCTCGVPKSFFLQFVKEHNYPNVADKTSTKTRSDGIESSSYNLPKTSSKANTDNDNIENMKIDEIKSSNDIDMETANNGIHNEASAVANVSTCDSAFKGIESLMPVPYSTACTRCRSEAFAMLKCKHSYCCLCLDYLLLNKYCIVERCYTIFPEKDVNHLLTTLNDNIIKESGIGSNQMESKQVHAQQCSSQPQRETNERTLSDDIKGVRNLGMTCYANSIFQILGQTENFKEQLKNGFIEALQRNVTLPLTENLAAILEQLNGGGTHANVETEVNTFLHKMVSLERSFGRYQMNDCCEFLMCIFDGLKAEDETAVSMFENTMKTFFKYKPCKHFDIGNPQIAHSLLIPLSKGGGSSYSVSAGLKELLKIETFGKQELPCRICNTTTETKQGLVLTKLPEILIIQIGRVKAKKVLLWSYAKKKDDLVRYDEDLEVIQTTKMNEQIQKITYNFHLFGVVLHSGSIDSGHYYSIVKKLHTDKWFSCNDSSVRSIDKKCVFDNPNAYLLFYERGHVIKQEVELQASQACSLM